MTFSQIEHILGTQYADEITGDVSNNTLDGGSSTGVDTLDGGQGSDTIFVRDGDDTILMEVVLIIMMLSSADWLSYDGVSTGANGVVVDLSSSLIIKDGFGDGTFDSTNNNDVMKLHWV